MRYQAAACVLAGAVARASACDLEGLYIDFMAPFSLSKTKPFFGFAPSSNFPPGSSAFSLGRTRGLFKSREGCPYPCVWCVYRKASACLVEGREAQRNKAFKGGSTPGLSPA